MIDSPLFPMTDLTVPSNSPIRIILVPQGPEYRAVKRGCQRSHATVSVVPLPMAAAAGEKLDRWMTKHKLFAEAGYLLVGLGGSVSPDLKVGDGVICETSQGLGFRDPPIALDAELNGWIRKRLPGLEVARAVGSDRIITLATDKLSLHQKFGASVVEMESLSVLRVLRPQGRRLAMIRVISDDCRHDLPDIAEMMRPDGSLRPLALASQLIRQPVGAGRLIIGSLQGLSVLERLMFELFKSS